MALWYHAGRHWKEVSMARDSSNLKGILVCGGPSLNKIDTSQLTGSGKQVFAVNNTYPTVKPDVWIGMDKPDCYDGRIFDEPFIKILRGSYGKEKRQGRTLTSLSNLFYADVEKCSKEELFLRRAHDCKFVWHENTMATALHMMVWMGHKEIYIAGCDLDNSRKDYFNEVTLKDSHQKRNKRLYEQLFNYLKWFKSAAARKGIQVFSLSPDSKINTFLKYVELEELNKDIESSLGERGSLPYVLDVKEKSDKSSTKTILHSSNRWIRGGIPLFIIDFMKAFSEFRHIIVLRSSSNQDQQLTKEVQELGGEVWSLPGGEITDDLLNKVKPYITLWHNRYPADKTVGERFPTIIWNHGMGDPGGYEQYTRMFVSNWVADLYCKKGDTTVKKYICPPCVNYNDIRSRVAPQRVGRPQDIVFGTMACAWRSTKFDKRADKIAKKFCDETEGAVFKPIGPFRTGGLWDYYNSIDCLLYMLGMNDGFGRAQIEAMAFGIGLIALDHTSPKEMVGRAGPHSGILIESMEDLPEAMAEFMKNKKQYHPNVEGMNFVKNEIDITNLRKIMLPIIETVHEEHNEL